MDDKHSKNKEKSTWKHEDIDTSFLNSEVQQDIQIKESKQKVKPPPVAHSYYLEYEQQARLAKKKAKDIQKKRRARQGKQCSDDDNDTKEKEDNKDSYVGNFSAAPINKYTKKKRKRIAKQRRKKEREENKSDDNDDREEQNEESSSSSSDSSNDATPNVRYGDNTAGRRKFGGIKKREKKVSQNKADLASSSSDEEEYKRKRANRKKKKKKKGRDDISSSDDTESGSDEYLSRRRKLSFKWQQCEGIKLEFEDERHVFMEMLTKPEGVLCGGENLMYYKTREGNEYIYLATDDDEEEIGVLEYDVLNEEWSKFVNYPAGFMPDLHGNCIDLKKHKLYIFDRKQFGILDLRTKEWKVRNNDGSLGDTKRKYSDTVSKVCVAYDAVDNNDDFVIKQSGSPVSVVDASALQLLGIQSVFMASPINGIHLFARTKIPPGSYHLLLDEDRKYVELNGFDRDELMRGHKLIYAEGCQKLILCGGQQLDEFDKWTDSKSIWCCDILSAYQKTRYNWRQLKCKLPYGGKTFAAIVAYQHILVIIYLRDNEKKEIYCLDLTEKEANYKFIKSSEIFPFEGDCEYTDVIAMQNEDVVHCLYFSLFGHCKLSLFKIVPNKLKNKCKIRWKMCVAGFIRLKISKKLSLISPQTVMYAIAKYSCELC